MATNLYSPESLAAMSTNAIIARLDLVACYSPETQRELAPAVKQLHEELDKRRYLADRNLSDSRSVSKQELVIAWRERGKQLNEYASQLRSEGMVREAEELENAANDYYIDASNLELEDERTDQSNLEEE